MAPVKTPTRRSFVRSASMVMFSGLACILIGGVILRSAFNLGAIVSVIEGLLLCAMGVLSLRWFILTKSIWSNRGERWAQRQQLRNEAGYDLRAARKYLKTLRAQLKGLDFMRKRQSLSPELEGFEAQVKAEVAKVEARIRLLAG